MKDHSARVLNATAAGLQVMADNEPLWVGKTAIENKVDAIKAKVIEIELIDDQITNGTGGTTQKSQAKENAAIKALRIAKPMAVFAKDTNNLELFGEIDFEWSDLRHAKEQDSLDRWQLVHDRGSANEAALIADNYIETGWVGELLIAITNFEGQRGKPKAKRSNTKALNAQLDLRIKELVAIKVDLIDLLAPFKVSHPEFYATVTAAFQLDMTGVRHLALRIRFTDQATGVRLPGVVGAIPELGLMKKSSSQGVIDYTRTELPPGNYSLQSVLSHYNTSAMNNIGVDHQELITLEVVMVKQNGSGTDTGTIGGTVKYQGVVVPGASVTAQGQSTTTNDQGIFVFSSVNAGNVTVTASLPSSMPQTPQSQQVSVTVGQTAVCNFDF